MDDLRLRTSTGDDVGVELQDYGGDDEPLWAVRAEKLLTTAELLALADAIRERYGAGA